MSLFKDSPDFALFYPALESVTFERILPSIDLVEHQYLRDQVLGATIYDGLHAAYRDSIEASPLVPLSTANANLLSWCKKAVAQLAAGRSLGTLNVTFTDTGAMVMSTANMQPAPRWRTRDAQSDALATGLSYLDQLISFLLESGNTYSWQDSPFATRVKGCIIRTVAEFQQEVDINNSGYLLYRLRPAMEHAQIRVRNILCDTAYEAMMAQVQAGSLSGPYATIVPLARTAVAHLCLAEQVPVLALTVDQYGVVTWKAASGGGDSAVGAEPASDRRVEHLQKHHTDRANEALKALQKKAIALAAAGSFPDFANSACYTRGATRPSTNTEGSGSYSML